ncbi:MAG: hypothetical protein RL419_945 [Actinomycetota bacterium]|jgi:hypothetical protein
MNAVLATNENSSVDPSNIVEAFVEVVDVFLESVDTDGYLTLLMRCSDLTHIEDGALVLVDSSGKSQIAAASSSEAAELVGSQLIAGRSPVLGVLASGLHCARDINPADMHFDPYVSRAVSLGFRHEYVLPLRSHGKVNGVIVLLSRDEAIIDACQLVVTQGVVDVAATAMVQARHIDETRTLARQLQEALDSRVVIEQAKGIIAERCETDVSRAFQRLRQLARETRRPISDVARGVIQGDVQVSLTSLARCVG